MKKLLTILLFVSACSNGGKKEPVSKEIVSTDGSLMFVNGYRYYSGKLFSGIIKSYDEAGILHETTEYVNGKENGWQLTYTPRGKLFEKRFYSKGEKDSVHTGWWENGNKRFEYHFSNGIYDGDFKEWYESGKPMKHIHYNKGVDDWGQGWRENGKVYMSFVVRNGRRYGLNNSNLCYTVKNEKGEYINSSFPN